MNVILSESSSITNVVAFASILSAIAAFGALVIGIWQARRMREGWQAGNALEVLRDIQSDDQRNKRGELYSLKARNIPCKDWSDEQRRTADSACSQLNAAAYLEKRGLLPPQMCEDIWGNVFRNLFAATDGYINTRRNRGDSNMWVPFTELAGEFLTRAPADAFYP